MKIFHQGDVEEAKQHSMDGGQALHLHRIIGDWAKAPMCFRRAIERGEDIAHLFDQDEVRLIATVKRLGVKIVVVEHPGTPRQHVDLCGAPLRRARQDAIEDDASWLGAFGKYAKPIASA